MGLFTVDNCTRVARVCSDRQRAGALPPPPELPLSVLVGCGGAENVFVRGGLWEEADRRRGAAQADGGVYMRIGICQKWTDSITQRRGSVICVDGLEEATINI